LKTITDISTIFGIFVAFGFVAFAIYMGQSDPSSFLDIKSIFIVIGGTFFLTVACFSVKEVIKSLGLIFKTIFYTAENPKNAAIAGIELAEIARRKGLLGLQKHEDVMNRNPFLRKGLGLVVDGIPFEDAERILINEINSILERHRTGVAILKKAAEISPAMGLIGTLIGLVQMLANLSDPSSIGPAMAVALLTTFYGAVLAYMVFIPIATKLERNTTRESLILKIYLNTVVSVGRKENPRRLEMLINALLPPAKRVKYFS